MKKISPNILPVIILVIMLFQLNPVSLFPASGGDRNRFFVLGSLGYASSSPRGMFVEAGVEIRLFGRFLARLELDHYFAGSSPKGNETVKQMNSASLYAVYKIPVSEKTDFRIKAGGHFSSISSQLSSYGLTLLVTKANIGFAVGAGFSNQLSNTLYIFSEITVKHLFLDEPWTWVQGQAGIMYRFR